MLQCGKNARRGGGWHRQLKGRAERRQRHRAPSFARAEALERRALLTITNGSFEAFPDFTGYNTIGNDTVRGQTFYSPVPNGTVFAALSNGSATGAPTPVAPASLESFLGVPAGTLNAAGGATTFNGSAIRQSFAGNAGDTISFRWNFLTNETATGGINDFAVFTLTPVQSGVTDANGAHRLARASDPLTATSAANAANSGEARETGFQTYTFTLPTNGSFTLGFAVANAGDAFGYSALLVDNIVQVTVPPPRVSGVQVGGSAWSAGYVTLVNPAPGATGNAMTGGSSELTTLPWGNVDRFTITFSRPVNVFASNLTVTGVSASAYAIGTFAYNLATNAATWTLATPVHAPERLTLTLDGTTANAVRDASTGLLLDGEWSAGISAFPSGNGTAGGNFAFPVNVLPGDANQDGTVNFADFVTLSNAFGTTTTAATTNADFNGSGTIDFSDFVILSNNFGSKLPAPAPAAFTPTPSTASALATTRLAPADAAPSSVTETRRTAPRKSLRLRRARSPLLEEERVGRRQ